MYIPYIPFDTPMGFCSLLITLTVVVLYLLGD